MKAILRNMKVVSLAFVLSFITIKFFMVESKIINLSKKRPKINDYSGRVCNLNGTLVRAITSKSNPYMRISSGYKGKIS